MMNRKKLMALTLAVIMLSATALSGCGAPTSSGSTPPASGSDPASTPASTPVAAEGGEVLIWNQIFEEWNQKYFTERAEEYNTLGRGYTNVQEFVPGDAWTERMTTAQASGTAPDTYVASYNHLVGLAQKQMIQPLDDLIPKAGLDDILPNVKEMVSFDGKIWAYPQLVEPSTVLYYRTDLFEAAGIAAPPKTWDETIEIAKKLQTPEVYGFGIPGYGDMGWCTWGWQYATAGHLAINDNWDAPTIDQGYRDLAEFYKRCYDEGVAPAQPLSGYGGIEGFAKGGLAMNLSGSWGVAGLINDYPEMADKFGVAPSPTKDGNQQKTTATNGGWVYVIDGKAKNAKGAADYISWLLAEDPETCGEFFKIAQFAKSAPRTSVQEWVAKEAGDNEWAAVINDVASYAKPEPVYPWDISTTVVLMFENIATGAMSTDEAVAQAEQTIKDIIVNQNLAGTNPYNK